MEYKGVVSIPVERYDELVKLESKIDVLLDRVEHDEYLRTDDMLRIIGTEKSLKIADAIESERDEYGFGFPEDVK